MTAAIEKSATSPSWSKSKTPIWVVATGPWETRVKKARYYLKHKAWIPENPRQIPKALMIVVCNLRRYHRLESHKVSALILECYAPRLMSKIPGFKPWTHTMIQEKFALAGKQGKYPTLGESDPRAKKKAAKLELKKSVRAFFKRHIKDGGACTPKELLEAFIAFNGGTAINAIPFGRMVVEVTGIKSTTPFGKRTYRGFHLRKIRQARKVPVHLPSAS